jgi:type IV secretory pathway VirB2 component (pilin)
MTLHGESHSPKKQQLRWIPMQTTLSSKRRRVRQFSSYVRRLALPSRLLLAALPVYAQSTGSDPWDNAVNVLKTAFTGTIATGLSLVAIVVGALRFARGEGQSKKTIARIVFGVGMAIGAVKFLTTSDPETARYASELCGKADRTRISYTLKIPRRSFRSGSSPIFLHAARRLESFKQVRQCLFRFRIEAA